MKLYYKGEQENTNKLGGDKGCCDEHDCCHHDRCYDDHKYAHCCPKSPCPYPILFECAQGTGADIPKLDPSKPFVPRSLGCVTVDTTCLKNPVVKFDFCTIIKFKWVANTEPARLTFGLFKTCDHRQEIPCGTWEYTVFLDASPEELTTSFCFSHCECNSCPGCCTYTVRIIEAANDAGDPLSLCNTSLSAIAKAGC